MTGRPARYFDPVSQQPYADAAAFKVLRQRAAAADAAALAAAAASAAASADADDDTDDSAPCISATQPTVGLHATQWAASCEDAEGAAATIGTSSITTASARLQVSVVDNTDGSSGSGGGNTASGH